MTVAELIEELKQCDEDALVFIQLSNHPMVTVKEVAEAGKHERIVKLGGSVW